jgi:hypothetical protein
MEVIPNTALKIGEASLPPTKNTRSCKRQKADQPSLNLSNLNGLPLKEKFLRIASTL